MMGRFWIRGHVAVPGCEGALVELSAEASTAEVLATFGGEARLVAGATPAARARGLQLGQNPLYLLLRVREHHPQYMSR